MSSNIIIGAVLHKVNTLTIAIIADELEILQALWALLHKNLGYEAATKASAIFFNAKGDIWHGFQYPGVM